MTSALVGLGSSFLASDTGQKLVNTALDSAVNIGQNLIGKIEDMFTSDRKKEAAKKKMTQNYDMVIQKMYEEGNKQLQQVYSSMDGIQRNLKRAFDRLDVLEDDVAAFGQRRKKQRQGF